MAGQDEGNMQKADGNEKNEIEPTLENSEENVVEEYTQLDTKLDELNTALDVLEQKNDDIQVKLKQLLQSNIEIRQQIRDENIKQNEQ